MRLSTSTNLYAVKRAGGWFSMEQSVEQCSAYGFKVLDANFCQSLGSADVLAPDDWRDRIEEIAKTAKRFGVDFSQSHLPFYRMMDPDAPNRKLNEMLTSRAIEATAMLGARWAVIHPGTILDYPDDRAKNQQANVDYFTPHLEHAKRFGVRLAMENMCGKRYCTTAEELCKLVDAFNDEDMVACWDFGHANLMGCDQVASLRILGDRLKTLHVADNTGVKDDHIAPFLGTIAWEEVMRTLVEIGYSGDFTYEIHGIADRVPDPLRESVARYALLTGEYLLKLADDYAKGGVQ